MMADGSLQRTVLAFQYWPYARPPRPEGYYNRPALARVAVQSAQEDICNI